MKRRSFILTTGVVGATFSTGFASTGIFFKPAAPWHTVKELHVEFIKPMDSFANELRHHLKNHHNCEELVKIMVMPNKVISQDAGSGSIIYQNAASSYVSIVNRKGKQIVSINHSLSKPG